MSPTQQAIIYIEGCPQCLLSLKQVPCLDPEMLKYRFWDFLRVGKGLTLITFVDFQQVYNHFHAS